MPHCISEEAEKILDKEYKIHNHGFVRLVDYLGTDKRIVQAARVSYGEGTKTVREDAGLIDYLMRNEHTSPFEQVVLTFHIKMPIFVARQWIRHRTARVNEISGRYSVMKDEFWLPETEAIALQSTNNKQGRENSALPEAEAEKIQQILLQGQEQAYKTYSELLDTGLARELARVNLPLSVYTEWYWQIDLHNLFRFLALRLDSHAQKEIRDYAQILLEITEKVCPLACNSFKNHMQNGLRLSAKEKQAVKEMLSQKSPDLTEREMAILKDKLNL